VRWARPDRRDRSPLAGEEHPVDIRTHDVTSHSLGMVVFRDGALHNSRSSSATPGSPASAPATTTSTTHDGQTTMDLWLVQGERTTRWSATCSVTSSSTASRPGPAESRLAVTYRYNANGIVEVEAMDLDSGQTLPHRLARQGHARGSRAKPRPMQVALLMDCSGSMYGQSIEDARGAARAFVERTLQPEPPDRGHRLPRRRQGTPTADMDRLRSSIDELTPIGSTPMADGLPNARELLRPKAGVQRVFVVMTDGHPDDPTPGDRRGPPHPHLSGVWCHIGVGAQVQQDFLRARVTAQDFHFCNESVELEGTFINLATELRRLTA
jgi:hypothetical protein